MKLEIRDKDHAAILDKHYHEQTVVDFAGVSLAIVGASCNYQPYRTIWGFEFAEVTKAKWAGEGHPPVGTVCEMTSNDGYNWRPVKIVFFDDYVTMVGEADGKANRELFKRCDADVMFRPIRTPEQIAEEERQKECQAIQRICVDAEDQGIPYFEALYDAGYRK